MCFVEQGVTKAKAVRTQRLDVSLRHTEQTWIGLSTHERGNREAHGGRWRETERATHVLRGVVLLVRACSTAKTPRVSSLATPLQFKYVTHDTD